MGNVTSISFFASVALQFIGTVAYLVQINRLFRRLQSHHPPVFEALGSPSLVVNNTARNNKLVFGWLWRRDYEAIDDVATVALARIVRRLLLGLIAGFLTVLILFFILQAG